MLVRATARLRRHVLVGLMILSAAGCTTFGVASARAAPGNGTPDLYASAVREAAQRFDIPEGWVRAVIRVESGGDPRAVSAAGAMGMMQIMPATWAELAHGYGLGGDPFDSRANIMAGTAYLRAMLDRYGNLTAALAAYNAGPARIDAWQAGRSALPAETICYVARITSALNTTSDMAGMLVTAGPPDWRSSALFGLRPVTNAGTAPNVQPNDDLGATPPSTNTVSGVTAPSPNALFIALSGAGSRHRPDIPSAAAAPRFNRRRGVARGERFMSAQSSPASGVERAASRTTGPHHFSRRSNVGASPSGVSRRRKKS